MAWQHVTCPRCSKPFRFDAGPWGQEARCPGCAAGVIVPGARVWYYAAGKEQHGPFTWEGLQEEVRAGRVRADTMVLLDGTARWQRADSLPGLIVNTPRGDRFRLVAAGIILAAVATAAAVIAWPARTETPADNGVSLQPAPLEPPPAPPVARPEPPGLPGSAVAALNAAREAAGLSPVNLDAELSAACLAHARYLAQNAASADVVAGRWREQDPALPGSTPHGREAARRSVVRGDEPIRVIAAEAIVPAGRAALLDPDLKSVGLGWARDAAGRWFTVLDLDGGRGDGVIVYPGDGQKGIPRYCTGWREIPGAERGDEPSAGFPITVTFPPGRAVGGVVATVRAPGGALVQCWVSTPSQPAVPRYQGNTICLIPRAPLIPGGTYRVQVSADVEGQPWSRSWAFTAEDDADDSTTGPATLARLNAARRRAGLGAVALDPELSVGCRAHARYLSVNAGHPATQGLRAHDERPNLPGFSEAGRKAGKGGVILWGHIDPPGSVESWMATLYHRVPLLTPQLRRVGLGHARRPGGGWVTVLDVTQGREDSPDPPVVVCPADGETGVPLAFASPEAPDPIPQSKDGRAGYPVTATFARGSKLRGLRLTLSGPDGIEVPSWQSSPERPANPKFPQHQGTTACVIARAPLRPETTYTVRGQGEVDGKPWSMLWTFTTGKGGFDGDAAAVVIARLNAYRRAAGLPLATLDATLARGCTAHAAYLARNADHPATQDEGVFNQDPTLPGSSTEGAAAGRNADILSSSPSPLLQVDDMLGTLARRLPLLDPALERVGFGSAEDVGAGWVTVLDHHRGRAPGGAVVLSPADGATGVPHAGSAAAGGGFPVIASFAPGLKVEVAGAAITEKGGSGVPTHASVIVSGRRVVVALIPSAPFRANSVYTASLSLRVASRPWDRSWTFTTAP